MVLSRGLCALLLLAGCNQSLFDANGNRRDGGTGGDDAVDAMPDSVDVPDMCPATCLADAAADFVDNGTRWRYVEDNRMRAWRPMNVSGGMATGLDPNNSIKRCTLEPGNPACQALPDALLVSSAGQSSGSDPALEYRSPDARVVQLAFRAHATTAHTLRLYRNSREDVLRTVAIAAGAGVEDAITVDAIPGDRFLIALEPTAPGGGSVALHFYVSAPPGKTFPLTCQLAVPFPNPPAVPPTVTVDDMCRGGDLGFMLNAGQATPLPQAPPYTEHGQGAYLENDYYYVGTQLLPRGNTTTVQLWIQSGLSSGDSAWVFSDLDRDSGGGLGIRLTNAGGPKLEAVVYTDTNPETYGAEPVPYPNPGAWHFVRVIHAGGTIKICIDGVQVTSASLIGPTGSGVMPQLGRHPAFDLLYYIGGVDDVRVFSEALPCD